MLLSNAVAGKDLARQALLITKAELAQGAATPAELVQKRQRRADRVQALEYVLRTGEPHRELAMRHRLELL